MISFMIKNPKRKRVNNHHPCLLINKTPTIITNHALPLAINGLIWSFPFMSVTDTPLKDKARQKARERSLTLSLPNLLTYGRILAVPLVVGCFFLDGTLGYWIAFTLFVAASLTDFLDGYLARAWSQQSAREIPNPNSAAAMIGLQDGTLLMACNPISGNRNRLSLLRSTDRGLTWSLVRVVEESADDRDEFSYPALLQDRQGHIHLLYTWKRQGIRHASFTQAWLNQPGNPIIPAVPR